MDIAKLTVNDTIGDDLTGGYITKIDWVDGPSWVSQYPPDATNPWNNIINFQVTSPKATTLLPVQQNYIQQYVDSFETALKATNFANPTLGWRKYADENSFIDFFILNEISKNVDGYRLSTYFYKDKNSNGGKLQMGPVWDFNLAWHNADYCNNEATAGWAYRITDYCQADVPFWWKRLLLDQQFANHLKCRWSNLRVSALDTTHLFNYIDSIATLLNQAKDRHFNQWPILGAYVWPNPSPLATTYEEEINNTKQWIRDRFVWMDANMPGTCSLASVAEHLGSGELMVYPNPASELISVNVFHHFIDKPVLEIKDAVGKQVLFQNFAINEDVFNLNISNLQTGIYFINVFDGAQLIGVKKVVRQ